MYKYLYFSVGVGVVSSFFVLLGFYFLNQSTSWGLNDALMQLAKNQNIQSDSTDLFDNYLKSCIWTYKIEGILLVLLGGGLFITSFLKITTIQKKL